MLPISATQSLYKAKIPPGHTSQSFQIKTSNKGQNFSQGIAADDQ